MPTMELKKILQSHGQAYTPQRETVWRFFAESGRGHTIKEAVESLQITGIGQATVYRTISLLEEVGALRRMTDQDGAPLYVAARAHHCHMLLCRSCHAVVGFDVCDLSVLEQYLKAQTGYIIQGHHLELYGLCPACSIPIENISQ